MNVTPRDSVFKSRLRSFKTYPHRLLLTKTWQPIYKNLERENYSKPLPLSATSFFDIPHVRNQHKATSHPPRHQKNTGRTFIYLMQLLQSHSVITHAACYGKVSKDGLCICVFQESSFSLIFSNIIQSLAFN